MSGSFETGASSIDLSGPPWNVTTTVDVYVRYADGLVGLFADAACTKPLIPPVLDVPYGQSTGLYFYIAAGSTAGVVFCDGLAGEPLPVIWGGGAHDCPATVTYGKILANQQAFSMSDFAEPIHDVSHSFDICLELPGGSQISVTPFIREDPTIVEKGEEPGMSTET